MEQQNARLAVIMPAYNAEKYLENTVRSILDQSYRELELIVVDDGSRDGTWNILSRLSAEDARLRPIRVENGGPARARNRGLDELSPDVEYVMFADADDELLPGAVEYAMKGAQDADMVFFGFTICQADGSSRNYSEPEQLLDRPAMAEAFGRLYKANLFNQVWAKLFRASLLRDSLRFPDYRWGEDRLFVFDCLERSSSIKVLPECMYRYIMHPGESLITRYYDKKPQVCMESDSKVQRLCELFGCGEETEADCRYMFAKSIFSCITTLFSDNCPLSAGEKRRYVAEIIGQPQVQSRCRDVFGGVAPKLLCAVIRSGSVPLNMLIFRAVAFAGQAAPAVFTRLKHRK